MTQAITVTGPLTLGGVILRCPGRGPGTAPRHLILMANGSTVMATCGEEHKSPDSAKRARCFWPMSELTPVNLSVLARGKPGAFRLTLPNGKVLEGTLAPPAAGQRQTAASRAATAVAAKSGKTPMSSAVTKPAGRATGGALTAALNAVTAAFNAAGQTAAATGQAISATAGAAGKIADVGRQGLITAQAGLDAADNHTKRRHERWMATRSDASDESDDGE